MEAKTIKEQLSLFGRTVALLLNRTLMYQSNHPVIKQSIGDLLTRAIPLLQTISPLVLILNRGQFYIDEEPLDPRINVNRIAGIWKNNDLQSVSFENGLKESELSIFAELFAALVQPATAQNLKDGLLKRGVFNIKVNHVTFKKVTEDDQVISRDALKKATPLLDAEDDQDRKKFMETVLESVLSEEFAKTLNITNLMANPRSFTQKMIEADLAGTMEPMNEHATGGGDGGAGVPGGSAGEGDGNGSGGGGTGDGRGTGAGTGSGPGLGNDTGTGGAGAGGASRQFGSDTIMGTGTLGNGIGAPGAGGLRRTDTGTVIDEFLSQEPADGTSTGGAPLSDGLKGHGAGTGGVSASAGTGTGAPLEASGASGQTGPGGGMAAGAGAGDAKTHGSLLIQQLEMMHLEVEKHLHGEGDVGITDLAQAIFDMKKQLLEGIQAQKALGVAYANEKAIVDAANKMTDQVLVELIKEEYKNGTMSSQRLAYFIRRLIPEASELKRLLPLIKKALMAEGMPGSEYLSLIHELRNELENEELIRALQESADSIGVEADELIEEIRRDPTQAAELIYLASEIRKGGGDESALSDILVEYVERLGNQVAKDVTEGGEPNGATHLKKVMIDVESSILKKLKDMQVDTDILVRMEQRINDRMETILDKMRVDWLHTHGGRAEQEKPKMLSVLQTLEHNVVGDDELGAILKIIRSKADAGEIEENNFSQIHDEIEKQKRAASGRNAEGGMQDGILSSDDLLYIIEKEIARAKRFGTPFSALALAYVTATPKIKSEEKPVTIDNVLISSLDKLYATFRETDYLGKIGKNRILVVLPMSNEQDSRNALSRVLRVLHAGPVDVNGVPVQLRVAGVVASYDTERALDANMFAKDLSNKLADMVSRVKSIQVLF